MKQGIFFLRAMTVLNIRTICHARKLARSLNNCIYHAHQTRAIYQVLPYSVNFKPSVELWNPLSKAVLSEPVNICCGTQRDSTTRYCCMALFRPIWPTRSTGYGETTNKIWTQLSNLISNINITSWNRMNDRTRNDLQQRVNDVMAEYYP